MTVVVQTSASLLLSKGQHRTCFRNARGLKYYYSFYYDTANSELRYETSAGGVTWGSAAAVTTDDPDCFDVKYHNDGSQMEVWVVWHTGGTIKYRAGTVADAASAITWAGAAQTIDGSIEDTLAGAHCIAIARTDNDEMVVAFTEDDTIKGKDYRFTKLIGSNGSGAAPTWSGEATWDNPSGSSNNQNKDQVWFGLESFSSSYGDRTFIFARVPLASTTDYQLMTAAPNWDQGGAGFTNTTQASWYTGSGGVTICGLIDEADKVHFVYRRTNQLIHRLGATAGDDDLGTETAIISSGASSDPATISLDTGPATDLLYVFYKRSNTLDWYYRSTPVDTISFSAEKTVSYHQNITALSSWNRQIENSLHIAGLYGTTVIYNEQPVYLGTLSTTLADLKFPAQNYYIGPHST